VAEIFRQKTRAEWEYVALELDCCIEPILRPDELRNDPHLAARGLFFDLDIDGTPVPQFRTPVTPRDATHVAPPKQGEHSEVILREGGLSESQIDALRASGALG
jgi:crotonobetainyl-CoA:carnitine CoA-transferase CaiB-like acyl-CoA transferase